VIVWNRPMRPPCSHANAKELVSYVRFLRIAYRRIYRIYTFIASLPPTRSRSPPSDRSHALHYRTRLSDEGNKVTSASDYLA
jgi:hypothetical protein